MNALTERLFYGLPDGQYPAIGKLMFTTLSDSNPDAVKKLPSGQMIGIYKNKTSSFIFARNGTNGPTGPGFCVAQTGVPCPTDVTANVFIMPGQSIFALQGQTRWIPVRPEDEQLIFNPVNGLLAANPLATTPPTPPEDILPENLLDLIKNSSPAFKVAAVVVVAAIAWYLLK